VVRRGQEFQNLPGGEAYLAWWGMMKSRIESKSAASAPRTKRMAVAAELVAVLVAVTEAQPRVLTIRDTASLPSGPLSAGHRSLQSGLRAWVEQQTHHPLGYVEQLYTFADRDRSADSSVHAISISYLGLTREAGMTGETVRGWRNWYDFLPWEDHRGGVPALLTQVVMPRLEAWAGRDVARCQRVAVTFSPQSWNEELALQRYELLFEAGLIPENPMGGVDCLPGRPMMFDHRRILATAIARLRAKIKYRPVVFELMPPTFTLLQLQRCVEAVAGRTLHKQNFRRLIEQQLLVEETGESTQDTGGRPAKLFRFRRDILVERAVTGTKLPLSRP
jgi:hypothetical protein